MACQIPLSHAPSKSLRSAQSVRWRIVRRYVMTTVINAHRGSKEPRMDGRGSRKEDLAGTPAWKSWRTTDGDCCGGSGMFVSTEKAPYSELPRNCTFSESDWHVLAGFWHPVAYSEGYVRRRSGRASPSPLSRVIVCGHRKRRNPNGISAACVHFTRHNPVPVKGCPGRQEVCQEAGNVPDHLFAATALQMPALSLPVSP